MKRHLVAASTLWTALVLGGCALTPTYQRPEAPIPQRWSHTADARASAVQDLAWQQFVTDADLRRLVEMALTNNRSLRQALLDIEQARAQYRIQRAERIPGLAGSASGSRQRVPSDLSATGVSSVTSHYQVGLSLPEYELDLFGRLQSLQSSALEEYLATEAAAGAARIALIAEVSQTYLSYAGAQQRLALAQEALTNRQRALQLIAHRRQAGTVSALDHQEAVGLVEQARAEIERITRERTQAFNALVLLLGTPEAASVIPEQPRDARRVLQDIAAGAPSELLERRPDILAAEHRLKARYADIGAARAAFFPRISLTGTVGSASAQLSGLFQGGSRAWSFLPTLTLPIFDGGRNQASLDLAEVRRDQAIAEYERTIQTAFREVADALAAVDTLRREEEALRALATASAEALRLARARYERGVDDHLRYLDAQRNAFANEMALIETATQRQIALVSLFRSLGGGWMALNPEPTP